MYAKTLYKTTPPKEIQKQILKYTRKKVPNFFQYAKDYNKNSVEPLNNSTVNKLGKFFKVKRLNYCKLPGFYYRKLMSDPDIVIDTEVIKEFSKLNRKYYYQVNTFEEPKDNTPYIIMTIKNTMAQFPYSDKEITDMLVKHLYAESETCHKAVLWACYGDIIVENLKNNIDPLSRVCVNCGMRFYPTSLHNMICPTCKESKTKAETVTKYCIECGEPFEVNTINKRKVRCDSCQEDRKREKARLRKQKQRALAG